MSVFFSNLNQRTWQEVTVNICLPTQWGQSLFESPCYIQRRLSGRPQTEVKSGNVALCLRLCGHDYCEWLCVHIEEYQSQRCFHTLLISSVSRLWWSVFRHNIAWSLSAWQSQCSFFPHFIPPVTPTLLPFPISPFLLLLHHFLLSHRYAMLLQLVAPVCPFLLLFRVWAWLMREKSTVWHHCRPPADTTVWNKSETSQSSCGSLFLAALLIQGGS